MQSINYKIKTTKHNSHAIKNSPPLDTRLTIVSFTWYRFQMDHPDQMSILPRLPSTKLAELANTFEMSVAAHLGGEAPAFRRVKIEHIDELINMMQGKGGRLLFMRHGEQDPANEARSIKDAARKKITMMRLPFNRDDPLTNQSIPEAAATALVLLYIKQVTGKYLRILCSENMRALQVADIIHRVISDSQMSPDTRWNCVNYKSDVSIESILQALPQGTIPWQKEIIDTWCEVPASRGSVYETIVNNVSEAIADATGDNNNTITLIVSHSQQLAAALQQASMLESPSIRLPELAMISFQASHAAKILLNGVLCETRY